MVAMLGVASGRVIHSFEIQVAKGTNGQKNGYTEESTIVLQLQGSETIQYYCSWPPESIVHQFQNNFVFLTANTFSFIFISQGKKLYTHK